MLTIDASRDPRLRPRRLPLNRQARAAFRAGRSGLPMTIDVVPLTPTIGAEVRGADLSGPLDEATMHTIEQALYEHLVLFFRDQEITPAQQIEFAGWFGPFELLPFVRYHTDY